MKIGKLYKLKEKGKLEINKKIITNKDNYTFEIVDIEANKVLYKIKDFYCNPLWIEKILFKMIFEEVE